MNFGIGMIIAIGCVLGGFLAGGGHLGVLWQPYELIVIIGSALGTFVIANPMNTIKDTGKATLEAIKGSSPKARDYLDILGILYTLMRELRGNAATSSKAISTIRRNPSCSRSTPSAGRQGDDDLHLRLLPPHHDRQRSHA